MYNLIAALNGMISITPVKINENKYLKVHILHNHLEYSKLLYTTSIWDETYTQYLIRKFLLEILDIKEDKDGD